MHASWKAGFFLSMVLTVAACGGGGGDSPVTAQPATVGVLLTDAPVAGFDQAIATITSVELLGNGAPVALFNGSQTIDLLELGDFSELFAVSDEVPPGTYSKIRLRLSALALNRLDPVTGAVVESVEPQLVGNGKIDLNPRGRFALAPGDVIFVELDFDMEKSLKITTTGNGKLIVRPVVFVDIRSDRPDGRLSRIHGEIRVVDLIAGAFGLCQSEFASRWDDDDDAGLRPGFGDEHCVSVLVDDATGIFDAEGLPQDLAGLEVGEKATVVGRVNRKDKDDDDDSEESLDHYFEMTAAVVEEGPLGTFRRLRGTAATTVDGVLDTFDLGLAPGQGFGPDTTLPVQLYPQSRLFNRAGEPLERGAIVPGRNALVDGVLVIGADDLIRSPLVFVDDDPSPAEDVLLGEIVSVDTAGRQLLVSDGTLDRCVSAADADIFLVDDDDGLSSSRGDLADLAPGDDVAVFGNETVDGCLAARTILAEE
ncbi:MAG: DUF4382 domain-containing protein [Gammaproteobacteria bacterium]|nr:DUF4382 domain-containing protein [Gammaproteobacteria bacterium]